MQFLTHNFNWMRNHDFFFPLRKEGVEGGREGEREATHYPSSWPLVTAQTISHWLHCTVPWAARHSDCPSDFATQTGIVYSLLQWLSATTWLLLFQKPIIPSETGEPGSMATSAMATHGPQRTDTAKLLRGLLFPKAFLSKGHVLNYILENVVAILNSFKHDMYFKCQICIKFSTQKTLL